MTIVDVRGAKLAVSTFGSPADPAVLLVGGAGASMDWWDPGLCAALAEPGRYVIRYDHRDTGESTSYPPGAPGYGSDDLMQDVAGLLEALSVPRAHLVGISMGGALAQVVALAHPDRVLTLTLISTTAGAGDPDLPPMADFEPLPEPDWTDREAVLEYQVESQRLFASRSRPYDAAAVRAMATVAHDRTTSAESAAKNHYRAHGGSPWRGQLADITAPTLVLHGTEDPLFPFGHGEVLAREIPGARLVPLPNTGHELTRDEWPLVVREITAHTA